MSTHGPEMAGLDGRDVRLALVTARFNEDLTDAMRQRAHREVQRLGARIVVDVRVPGTYDLPLAVDHCLARSDVEAAVALGVLVTGGTGHDEAIGAAALASLLAVALKHGKPVGLGVTGPRQDRKQAEDRVDRADYAVRSAVAQFQALQGIRAHDA